MDPMNIVLLADIQKDEVKSALLNLAVRIWGFKQRHILKIQTLFRVQPQTQRVPAMKRILKSF